MVTGTDIPKNTLNVNELNAPTKPALQQTLKELLQAGKTRKGKDLQ